MKTSGLVGILLFLTIPTVTSAQSAPQLDDNIACVLSGGHWETPESRGIYRVVVTNDGWDHVTSQVFIQWLEENQSEQRIRVADTRLVQEIPPGLWAVACPELQLSPSGTTVRLTGTSAHAADEHKSITLRLGPPGRYTLATPSH